MLILIDLIEMILTKLYEILCRARKQCRITGVNVSRN